MNWWNNNQFRNRPTKASETDTIACVAAICLGAAVALILLLKSVGAIAAEAATTQCPTPGEPCKIVIITPQEEQLLIKQGGILDTAQAGRYIDLGNIVAYFRMKLANAPSGEVKAKEEKPAEAPKP